MEITIAFGVWKMSKKSPDCKTISEREDDKKKLIEEKVHQNTMRDEKKYHPLGLEKTCSKLSLFDSQQIERKLTIISMLVYFVGNDCYQKLTLYGCW